MVVMSQLKIGLFTYCIHALEPQPGPGGSWGWSRGTRQREGHHHFSTREFDCTDIHLSRIFLAALLWWKHGDAAPAGSGSGGAGALVSFTKDLAVLFSLVRLFLIT